MWVRKDICQDKTIQLVNDYLNLNFNVEADLPMPSLPDRLFTLGN